MFFVGSFDRRQRVLSSHLKRTLMNPIIYGYDKPPPGTEAGVNYKTLLTERGILPGCPEIQGKTLDQISQAIPDQQRMVDAGSQSFSHCHPEILLSIQWDIYASQNEMGLCLPCLKNRQCPVHPSGEAKFPLGPFLEYC